MKNLIKLLCFSFIVMIFISGCTSNNVGVGTDVFQFKDSFVGDNSAVGNIAYQLPGTDDLEGFELSTNEEPYGITLFYDWNGSEEAYMETVKVNSIYLFTLIQNVDWVTFHSDVAEYTVTTDRLNEWYGKGWNDIQTEEELKEFIQ